MQSCIPFCSFFFKGISQARFVFEDSLTLILSPLETIKNVNFIPFNYSIFCLSSTYMSFSGKLNIPFSKIILETKLSFRPTVKNHSHRGNRHRGGPEGGLEGRELRAPFS